MRRLEQRRRIVKPWSAAVPRPLSSEHNGLLWISAATDYHCFAAEKK